MSFARSTCCSNGTETPLDTTPGASLAGLSWRLPGTVPTPDNGAWQCGEDAHSAVMSGAVGVSYDVTLHFQGVVEGKTYTGGTNDGASWQIGGTPAADGYNVYTLSISSPFQTFYINRGSSGDAPAAIDYSKTIQIDTGATVSLTANNGGDGFELKHTISVGGITDPAQPYQGQWANMTVTAVAPH